MRYLLFALLAYLSFVPVILADERSNTVRQIEMAKIEVSQLEKALATLKGKQTSLLKELRKTETDIANLQKEITKLKTELTNTEHKITWLKEEQQKTEQLKQQQEKVFASQAKATYESGRQEYLKLLLNQQQPDKLSRTLVYYDYLSQARLIQLTEFKETVKQLADIEAEMNHYQQQLNDQQQKLQQQAKQLADTRQKRLQVLATINKQIKQKNDQIFEREKDQIALSKVLRTIDATLTQQASIRALNNQNGTTTNPHSLPTQQVIASSATFDGNFNQAQGKLSWPVSGKLIANYGSARGDDTRSKWDGVIIAAPTGTPVKAVHSGTIVYSDWLRGVGWLIIIDHGQGYYSLYGHNQTLLKKVGNTIKTGDTIATVGNSGGSQSAALYFSIRQHGQAVNPALWCH